MLFFSLNAQEWDEITDEELAMSDFPDYHEADAVILFDIGQLEITTDFKLEIRRHVRITHLLNPGMISQIQFTKHLKGQLIWMIVDWKISH